MTGLEAGGFDPAPHFAACYSEDFLPLHPWQYSEMLAEKCAKHNTRVWLVNTGWVRGPVGVGQRMSLTQTRAIIDSIHDESMDLSEHIHMRRF